MFFLIFGMDIWQNVKISRNAILDISRYPEAIHFEDDTMITGV
jgi:hypothetical protein